MGLLFMYFRLCSDQNLKTCTHVKIAVTINATKTKLLSFNRDRDPSFGACGDEWQWKCSSEIADVYLPNVSLLQPQAFLRLQMCTYQMYHCCTTTGFSEIADVYLPNVSLLQPQAFLRLQMCTYQMYHCYNHRLF